MEKHYWLLLTGLLIFASCGEKSDLPLVLNEICGKEFPDNEWVEICNTSNDTVNLQGVYVLKVDEDGIDHEVFRFGNEKLAPHGIYVISSLNGKLERGISRKREVGIELVAPDDKTIDDFYRDEEVGENPHPKNGSYARIPNAEGFWQIVDNASRGMPNPNEEDELSADDDSESED